MPRGSGCRVILSSVEALTPIAWNRALYAAWHSKVNSSTARRFYAPFHVQYSLRVVMCVYWRSLAASSRRSPRDERALRIDDAQLLSNHGKGI